MTMDSINEVFAKKAFEINYAIFRISQKTKNPKFSHYLEGYSLDLLGTILVKDYVAARDAITGLTYFLRLGGEAGLISHNNIQTVSHEVQILDSAIAEYSEDHFLPEVDLRGIFSPGDFIDKKVKKTVKSVGERGIGSVITETDYGLVRSEESIDQDYKKGDHLTNEVEASVSADSVEVSGRNSATMRQSAILDKIRQSGYCRLKDIQDILPDSSERTLRYDLQKLIDQDSIERIGSGGPASFYRVKREAN